MKICTAEMAHNLRNDRIIDKMLKTSHTCLANKLYRTMKPVSVGKSLSITFFSELMPHLHKHVSVFKLYEADLTMRNRNICSVLHSPRYKFSMNALHVFYEKCLLWLRQLDSASLPCGCSVVLPCLFQFCE